RLLVGRSNQNSEVNRAFAKELKAVADKKYPGLVKDIFIGKGNYNQDLSPNAILLEFGTHTISKERVLNSTDVMADVFSTTLYGTQTGSARSTKSESAEKASASAKNKGSMSGIAWLAVIVVVGVILFALVQTGGGKAMGTKIGRNLREMTGGLVGKKKDEDAT
ncbi:MAG: stage II sporulation protein P, partial [Candidatus Ventricola sp.]